MWAPWDQEFSVIFTSPKVGVSRSGWLLDGWLLLIWALKNDLELEI